MAAEQPDAQQDRQPIRVLIVDDQTVVREGLASLLSMFPQVVVVGTAKNGTQAIVKAAESNPDVILMDLVMPEMDGIEATRRVTSKIPATRVLALTTYTSDELLLAALRAGIAGFLTKDADSGEIIAALHTVVRGEVYLAQEVQRRLLEHVTGSTPAICEQNGACGAKSSLLGHSASLPDGLTRREAEVLAAVVDGLTNAEIADRLSVAEATVKTHVNRALTKTGLTNRAQLVTYALRHGLAAIPEGR